jgi:protein-S-isoprenylcysteine O-methyltransferase Ste14
MHATVLGGGWAPVAVGLTVLAAGVALRTWAILTLGRLFKFVVVIQDDHKVVAAGPYRLLRHPSYTGGLVAFLGAGLALDSWLSMLAMVVLPLTAILARIHVEETELATALGQEYRSYASRTHRLVPGLW